MELTLYGITKEIQVLEELWEMAIDEETGEIKDSNVLEELQSDIEVILQEKSASLVKYCKARDCFIDNVGSRDKKATSIKKSSN